jgi:hypothetical protein
MKIRIVATGEYPRDLPEALAKALAYEMEGHMSGYGLESCAVRVASDDGETIASDRILGESPGAVK